MTLVATGMVVGGQATISLTSHSRVGQNVVVTLTGGGGQSTTVNILVGAGSTGQTTWTVQDWGDVTLSDGVCDQVNYVIAQPPEEPPIG